MRQKARKSKKTRLQISQAPYDWQPSRSPRAKRTKLQFWENAGKVVGPLAFIITLLNTSWLIYKDTDARIIAHIDRRAKLEAQARRLVYVSFTIGEVSAAIDTKTELAMSGFTMTNYSVLLKRAEIACQQSGINVPLQSNDPRAYLGDLLNGIENQYDHKWALPMSAFFLIGRLEFVTGGYMGTPELIKNYLKLDEIRDAPKLLNLMRPKDAAALKSKFDKVEKLIKSSMEIESSDKAEGVLVDVIAKFRKSAPLTSQLRKMDWLLKSTMKSINAERGIDKALEELNGGLDLAKSQLRQQVMDDVDNGHLE